MPHLWSCSDCGKEYRRHRQSIDVVKHSCSSCRGRLLYRGSFDRQGRSESERREAAPTANGYAGYVKSQFASVRSALPPGTPNTDIMKHIGLQWRAQKGAGTPAAGGGALQLGGGDGGGGAAAAAADADDDDGGMAPASLLLRLSGMAI